MDDRTVLVTGCGSGIGRATALAFVDRGWRVYATARDEEAVADLADAGCETDELDVTEPTAVRRVVKRVVAEADRLDCVVAAGGYAAFGPLADVEEDAADRQFDETVLGFHRLVRRAVPHMRSAGDGTVVAVSSVLGRVAGPGTGVYSGATAALEAMCDSLRAEVAGEGVGVVVVEPALVETQLRGPAGDAADGATQDATGAGGWIADVTEDVALLGRGGLLAVPPERVADQIVDAACESRPEARYAVGPVAEYAVRARYLPDRWRDLLYGVLRRLA